MQTFLKDEADTLALGEIFAKACPETQFSIFLEGELGAGKTTFSRGFLQALGHQGKVKSPTYTLVENYQLGERDVFHFDLYRLSDPGELEYLGLDDYFSSNHICLVEWAKNGSEYLPQADITLHIHYQNQARQVDIAAHTDIGQSVYEKLQTQLKF